MQILELELCAALLLDADGVVSRVGVGFQRILAWEASEILGKPWHDLCRAEHKARFERAFSNVNAGAPSATVRARFPRYPDEVTLVSRIAKDETGYLVVCEDVSTRNAAFEGGARMEDMVDFAADAWLVHDLEGRIKDANRWACKNLGYSREEMLALHIADIEMTIKPGRMDGVWNRMEIGVPISVEGLQRRKDGSTFPVDVRLGLFEAGDDVLMLAVARDITKLKRVEAELHSLNTELEAKVTERTREMAITLAQRQAMLDSLGDAIVAVTSAGTVELANPRLREMFATGAAVGAPMASILPGPIVDFIEGAMTGNPQQGEVGLPGGLLGDVAASPILHDDKVDGVVARIRDVTFEREIDRMKTDFIATVSHELRTPLTSVLGFATITRNQLESKVFPHIDLEAPGMARAISRVRSNIDIIRSEGERLTALINDVLDISKMEAGRMEWNFEPVDAKALVAQATDAVSALFVDSPELLCDVQEGLPPIRADRHRLLQVLINLLSNAAKFADSRVTICARAVVGGVEFSVEDDGCGIEPAMHGSIFEKFKQVGETMTNRPQGTGLGLPICAQIAEAHGTRILVESRLGTGATFRLTIGTTSHSPARSAHLDALLERIERHAPEIRHAGGDILVVDDDPSIRELLRQELSERGYTIRQASNGFEAIGQVRAARPDLIILDVMMPELSGFDVASMLKTDPTTDSIPILILSILEDPERGLQLGVDRYMTKPADTAKLLETVRELIAPGSVSRRVLIVQDGAASGADETLQHLLQGRGYEVVHRCNANDMLASAREHQPNIIVLETAFEDQDARIREIRKEQSLAGVFVVHLLPGGTR